jgi:hypothetical protein
MVQQLYLKPTLMKSFGVASLTVSRSQITAIDNQKITVRVPTVREDAPAKVAAKAATPGNFENPFRKPKPVKQPADIND